MANTKVTSTIVLNHGFLSKLDKAAVQALEQTADAVMTDLKTSQTMPFDTGTLQNDSTFLDVSDSKNGHVSIVSSTPYARRMYFHPEYDFSRDENAKAGGRWFDQYLTGRKKSLPGKLFAQIYRRISGV